MALESDPNGFLKGRPLSDGDATRFLAAIKGDTGKILAAMRRMQSSGGQPYGRKTASPAVCATLYSPRMTPAVAVASSAPIRLPQGKASAMSKARWRGRNFNP